MESLKLGGGGVNIILFYLLNWCLFINFLINITL